MERIYEAEVPTSGYSRNVDGCKVSVSVYDGKECNAQVTTTTRDGVMFSYMRPSELVAFAENLTAAARLLERRAAATTTYTVAEVANGE